MCCENCTSWYIFWNDMYWSKDLLTYQPLNNYILGWGNCTRLKCFSKWYSDNLLNTFMSVCALIWYERLVTKALSESKASSSVVQGRTELPNEKCLLCQGEVTNKIKLGTVLKLFLMERNGCPYLYIIHLCNTENAVWKIKNYLEGLHKYV